MKIMPNLGGGELIIVLIIVLLLFGVGRVSRIGGELGSAVANFRKGLDQGKQQTTPAVEEEKTELPS
jgi:sec-independent protein translocase protein TatA